MGSRNSRAVTPFEEHLLWIEENRGQDGGTVTDFRRAVPTTSPWYKKVQALFSWQWWTGGEYHRGQGAVSDLVGEMRLAVESVKVNRVDVF